MKLNRCCVINAIQSGVDINYRSWANTTNVPLDDVLAEFASVKKDLDDVGAIRVRKEIEE